MSCCALIEMLTRWGRCFVLICSLIYIFLYIFRNNNLFFKSCIHSTSSLMNLFSNSHQFQMFDEKEYVARQNNLFRLLRQVQPLCDQNLVILLGKRNIKRSRDINYEFYQDTDIRYFIGRNVPNEIYILDDINTSSEVLIFTNQSSEHSPHSFKTGQMETVLQQRYDSGNQSMLCLWHKTIDSENNNIIFEKQQFTYLFS